MGKVRVAKLGDEAQEKKLAKRAQARRQTKKSKKEHVEGVGLKGGERVSVVEGTQIKDEYKKLVEEVEEGVAPGEKKPSKKSRKVKVRSKRYQELAKLVDKTKQYSLSDALKLVKQTSMTKFDGTVEIHINLNPLSLGEKKEMRGSANLPHGTGKQVRVVIADDAIVAQVETGKIEFDILVAHPSMMPKLAKIARILGPKGLMPNPKTGTVTPDPEKRAKELSHGQVNFKTEPDQPIIHMSIGKVSFEEKKLADNVNAVLDAIGRGKIARVTLSPTMGPGVKIALT